METDYKPRFTKQLLIDYIEKRQAELLRQFPIDPANGTAQLKASIFGGRLPDICVAYGEYDGLDRLIEALEVK